MSRTGTRWFNQAVEHVWKTRSELDRNLQEKICGNIEEIGRFWNTEQFKTRFRCRKRNGEKVVGKEKEAWGKTFTDEQGH
jgi:hypothetical protein